MQILACQCLHIGGGGSVPNLPTEVDNSAIDSRQGILHVVLHGVKLF